LLPHASFPDQPLSKSAGGYKKIYPEYPPKCMIDFIMDILKQKISLVAIDKETDKVIGIRIQYVVER
jgi:hypothetical protein